MNNRQLTYHQNVIAFILVLLVTDAFSGWLDMADRIVERSRELFERSSMHSSTPAYYPSRLSDPTNPYRQIMPQGVNVDGINLYTGQYSTAIPLTAISAGSGVRLALNLAYRQSPEVAATDLGMSSIWSQVGWDWSLNLPYIARIDMGTVEESDDLFFCNLGALGGGQLFYRDGSIVNNTLEFALESNPNVAIIATIATPQTAIAGSVSSGGMLKWTVVGPDGVIYRFGGTKNAIRHQEYYGNRILDKLGVDGSMAYQWDLSEVRNVGVSTALALTWHQVKGSVGTGSNLSTYTMNSRLASIEALDKDNNAIRKLEFTYETHSGSHPDRNVDEFHRDLFDNSLLRMVNMYELGALRHSIVLNYDESGRLEPFGASFGRPLLTSIDNKVVDKFGHHIVIPQVQLEYTRSPAGLEKANVFLSKITESGQKETRINYSDYSLTAKTAVFPMQPFTVGQVANAHVNVKRNELSTVCNGDDCFQFIKDDTVAPQQIFEIRRKINGISIETKIHSYQCRDFVSSPVDADGFLACDLDYSFGGSFLAVYDHNLGPVKLYDYLQDRLIGDEDFMFANARDKDDFLAQIRHYDNPSRTGDYSEKFRLDVFSGTDFMLIQVIATEASAGLGAHGVGLQRNDAEKRITYIPTADAEYHYWVISRSGNKWKVHQHSGDDAALSGCEAPTSDLLDGEQIRSPNSRNCISLDGQSFMAIQGRQFYMVEEWRDILLGFRLNSDGDLRRIEVKGGTEYKKTVFLNDHEISTPNLSNYGYDVTEIQATKDFVRVGLGTDKPGMEANEVFWFDGKDLQSTGFYTTPIHPLFYQDGDVLYMSHYSNNNGSLQLVLESFQIEESNSYADIQLKSKISLTGYVYPEELSSAMNDLTSPDLLHFSQLHSSDRYMMHDGYVQPISGWHQDKYGDHMASIFPRKVFDKNGNSIILGCGLQGTSISSLLLNTRVISVLSVKDANQGGACGAIFGVFSEEGVQASCQYVLMQYFLPNHPDPNLRGTCEELAIIQPAEYLMSSNVKLSGDDKRILLSWMSHDGDAMDASFATWQTSIFLDQGERFSTHGGVQTYVSDLAIYDKVLQTETAKKHVAYDAVDGYNVNHSQMNASEVTVSSLDPNSGIGNQGSTVIRSSRYIFVPSLLNNVFDKTSELFAGRVLSETQKDFIKGQSGEQRYMYDRNVPLALGPRWPQGTMLYPVLSIYRTITDRSGKYSTVDTNVQFDNDLGVPSVISRYSVDNSGARINDTSYVERRENCYVYYSVDGISIPFKYLCKDIRSKEWDSLGTTVSQSQSASKVAYSPFSPGQISTDYIWTGGNWGIDGPVDRFSKSRIPFVLDSSGFVVGSQILTWNADAQPTVKSFRLTDESHVYSMVYYAGNLALPVVKISEARTPAAVVITGEDAGRLSPTRDRVWNGLSGWTETDERAHTGIGSVKANGYALATGTLSNLDWNGNGSWKAIGWVYKSASGSVSIKLTVKDAVSGLVVAQSQATEPMDEISAVGKWQPYSAVIPSSALSAGIPSGKLTVVAEIQTKGGASTTFYLDDWLLLPGEAAFSIMGYDGLGRKVSQMGTDLQPVYYEYDALGRASLVRDAKFRAFSQSAEHQVGVNQATQGN